MSATRDAMEMAFAAGGGKGAYQFETDDQQLIRINTQALENTLFDLVSVRDGHVNIEPARMVPSVARSLRAIADHLEGV
jgi:hypothetical protein